METPISETSALLATQKWVEKAVVGLNLCPFAKRELKQNRVRFVCEFANTETALLEALTAELHRLEQTSEIETTLLIHPAVLQDFYDYNTFLGLAEEQLLALQYEGIFQIASFHPQYQFAGTLPNDVENYTNRSPYPMLHLLREASLEQTLKKYPDPEQIPERNITLMNEMGTDAAQSLLKSCYGIDP